jgi:hypothetical protein
LTQTAEKYYPLEKPLTYALKEHSMNSIKLLILAFTASFAIIPAGANEVENNSTAQRKLTYLYTHSLIYTRKTSDEAFFLAKNSKPYKTPYPKKPIIFDGSKYSAIHVMKHTAEL